MTAQRIEAFRERFVVFKCHFHDIFSHNVHILADTKRKKPVTMVTGL